MTKEEHPLRARADRDASNEEEEVAEGLSLEELGQTYAKLMGADLPEEAEEPAAAAEDADDAATAETSPVLEPPADEEAISPRMIVEAVLFVGDPAGQPVSSKEIAALMRGVTAEEVDGYVRELEALYEAEGCPYRIESVGAGYRLQLREELHGLSDRFHRTVRQARLSQSAIDVLAIVAYQPGLSRDEVDRLRGKPSSGILSQLVRRQLLRLERPADEPRNPHYFPTERFLALFNLGNLEELPRG